MSPDIWFRNKGWRPGPNEMFTQAFDSHAIVQRAPNMESRRPLVTKPSHPEGVFVAGEFDVDAANNYQMVGEPRLWEADSPFPLTAESTATTLDPPAFSPLLEKVDLSLVCIARVKVVKQGERLTIVDTRSVRDGKCRLWLRPADLARNPTIAAEQAAARECRAYGWLQREVIEDKRPRARDKSLPDLEDARTRQSGDRKSVV